MNAIDKLSVPATAILVAVIVHSSASPVGTFATANPLLNRIQAMSRRTFLSNLFSVQSDCPHREKLGWLECAYLLQPSFLYRYDGSEWFNKIARDVRDAQEPSGRVLTVAPSYPARRFPSAFGWTVEWGAAAADYAAQEQNLVARSKNGFARPRSP